MTQCNDSKCKHLHYYIYVSTVAYSTAQIVLFYTEMFFRELGSPVDAHCVPCPPEGVSEPDVPLVPCCCPGTSAIINALHKLISQYHTNTSLLLSVKNVDCSIDYRQTLYPALQWTQLYLYFLHIKMQSNNIHRSICYNVTWKSILLFFGHAARKLCKHEIIFHSVFIRIICVQLICLSCIKRMHANHHPTMCRKVLYEVVYQTDHSPGNNMTFNRHTCSQYHFRYSFILCLPSLSFFPSSVSLFSVFYDRLSTPPPHSHAWLSLLLFPSPSASGTSWVGVFACGPHQTAHTHTGGW